MSCCGKNRSVATATTRSAVNAPATRPHSASAAGNVSRPTSFEYVGGRGVTVIGQGTGYQYRFVGRGARLSVDPRDRASLAAVPGLREVRA